MPTSLLTTEAAVSTSAHKEPPTSSGCRLTDLEASKELRLSSWKQTKFESQSRSLLQQTKSTSSLNKVSIQSVNDTNRHRHEQRREQRKAKLGGYRYVSSFKPSYGYKEEHKGYETDKEHSEHNAYYRHDKHDRHERHDKHDKKRHK